MKLEELQGRIYYFSFCGFLLWVTLWSVLDQDALPGGSVFSLLAIVLTSYVVGELFDFLKGPKLLGMILTGFAFRNISAISIVATGLSPQVSNTVRGMALVVLVLRAGAGLELPVLKERLFIFLRLAFLPCLVEATALTFAARVILNMPWIWCLMLGFVVGAVSPAVVISSMLKIQEKQLGTKKGIPTLAIGAVCFDNILAIAAFQLILEIHFQTDYMIRTVLKGPLELLVGAAAGGIIASIFWATPVKFKSTQRHKDYMFFLVFLIGCLFYFTCQRIDITPAGPVACLSLAVISRRAWKPKTPGSTEVAISYIFKTLWKVLQPALFGIIGTMLVVDKMDGDFLGLCIAVLVIGLVFRMGAVVLALLGTELNLKEKLVVSLAWTTKATVQAIIGPAALEAARNVNAGEKDLGEKVLMVAVLSVLLTAPAGIFVLSFISPKLLSHDTEPDQEMQVVCPAVTTVQVGEDRRTVATVQVEVLPTGATVEDTQELRQNVATVEDTQEVRPTGATVQDIQEVHQNVATVEDMQEVGPTVVTVEDTQDVRQNVAAVEDTQEIHQNVSTVEDMQAVGPTVVTVEDIQELRPTVSTH